MAFFHFDPSTDIGDATPVGLKYFMMIRICSASGVEVDRQLLNAN